MEQSRLCFGTDDLSSKKDVVAGHSIWGGVFPNK